MSEIKINGNLLKKANQILKNNQTNFTQEFNKVMDQIVELDQVPFGLEEYDTKDVDNFKLSLNDLDINLEHQALDVLKSMDIPLAYVINGYCRRVILEKKVPKFKVNFIPYK